MIFMKMLIKILTQLCYRKFARMCNNCKYAKNGSSLSCPVASVAVCSNEVVLLVLIHLKMNSIFGMFMEL